MKTLRERPADFSLFRTNTPFGWHNFMSFSELENKLQGVKCTLRIYANNKVIKHDIDYLYLDTDPYSIDTDVRIFDGEAPDEKFNPLAYFDITKSIFYENKIGYYIVSEVIEIQEDYRDWFAQCLEITIKKNE